MAKIFSTIKYSIVILPPLLLTLWTAHFIWLQPGDLKHMGHQWIKVYQRSARGNVGDKEDSDEKLLTTELEVRVYSRNVTNSALGVHREYHVPKRDIKVEKMANCPAEGERLVGPLYVDQRLIKDIEELERGFSLSNGGWVEKGGAWKPQHCQANKKVAIIIPYRNRYEQLKLFLRHMHPILKRQLLDYRIFTVEQEGTTPFNRAILFNIGFNESLRFNNYECFVFHDVDLLPETDENFYNCPSSPRHMCPAVDKFSYRLPYSRLFGGVEAFLKEHFKKINGFSNKYWGWGAEDDDLRIRVDAVGLRVTRPSMKIGRYKMIKIHHYVDSIKTDPVRIALYHKARTRIQTDGLNSLKYKLLKTVNHPLYTNVLVRVDPKPV